MDFSTIKKNLDLRHYSNPEEFAEDVRLVFSNAKTYNGKGTDVYVMADTIQDTFESLYSRLIQKLENIVAHSNKYDPDVDDNSVNSSESRSTRKKRKRYSDEPAWYAPPPQPPSSSEIEAVTKIIKEMQSRLEKLEREVKELKEVHNTPVSTKDIADLRNRIETLNERKREDVFKIIRDDPSYTFSDTVQDTVDLSILTPDTLRKIQRIVSKYGKKDSTSRISHKKSGVITQQLAYTDVIEAAPAILPPTNSTLLHEDSDNDNRILILYLIETGFFDPY